MLLSLAIAPALILLFYIYIRDKYEKEPIRLLVVGVFFGLIITVPIVLVGNILTLFLPSHAGQNFEAFYTSFVIAAFVEEIFKYVVLFFLVWSNRNFNEKFDGLVYAVFVSLGFAAVENILYVFSEDMGGMVTALTRAVFSVPGHGLFAVFMGYFLSKARFNHPGYLVLAFVVPWLIHGVFNFFLLWTNPLGIYAFALLLALLWHYAFKIMRYYIQISPFKPII